MPTIYEILQDAKRQWGIETVQAIKNKIGQGNPPERPPIFTSNLLNSIGLNQDDTLDGNITFKMADYGKYIDEGTGLNGPKGQAIPLESLPGMAYYLQPWAQSKNLNAWAVARSIINKGGLKPRKFFKDVIEARLPQLELALGEAYTTYLNEAINRQQNP